MIAWAAAIIPEMIRPSARRIDLRCVRIVLAVNFVNRETGVDPSCDFDFVAVVTQSMWLRNRTLYAVVAFSFTSSSRRSILTPVRQLVQNQSVYVTHGILTL